MDTVKAFGVKDILPGCVEREAISSDSKTFPHIPKGIFEEIKQKPVDLLVGNADLRHQPQCVKGFGQCTDCASDRCCYRSWYGSGWVMIGRLTGLGDSQVGITSSIRQLALSKVSATPSAASMTAGKEEHLNKEQIYNLSDPLKNLTISNLTKDVTDCSVLL